MRLLISLELMSRESSEAAPHETANTAPISPGIAADIRRVLASCPPRQRAEFYSLVALKSLVWLSAVTDVAERLICLRGLAAEEALLLMTGRFSEGQLRSYAKELSRLIRELRQLLALYEAIEARHFDGAHLLGRDLTHPLGIIGLTSRVIAQVVEGHKCRLLRAFAESEDAVTPNPLDIPVHELLLDPNPDVDEKWVQARLSEMERLVSGCGWV